MFGDKFNLGGIGSLMKNAKKIQEMMEQTQAELAKIVVTGESGGGVVKVVINAKYLVKEVIIEDELLSEPKEVVQDLIAAAFNSAVPKVEEITKSKMMDVSRLLGGAGEESEK